MLGRLCLDMSSFLHTCACVKPRIFLLSHEILFPALTADRNSGLGSVVLWLSRWGVEIFFSGNMLYTIHPIEGRLRGSSIKLYVGTVPTLCILNVGTVLPLCILNVGTVPMLCILNVGTVPTLSPSELVLSQWPPLWWMGRPCRQRAQRRRCSKIVNFGRTEGCCTKKWGRISPGFRWFHQK